MYTYIYLNKSIAAWLIDLFDGRTTAIFLKLLIKKAKHSSNSGNILNVIITQMKKLQDKVKA